MEVTFTKLPGRRYTMTVHREHGPVLAPRQGPGYDDHLPHDAVHFLVEAAAGIGHGVFGQVAAGHSNIFEVAEPGIARRVRRREARHASTPAERADTGRSELLASVCERLWRVRQRDGEELPGWFSSVNPSVLEDEAIPAILDRLDDFATAWSRLQPGRSVTLAWP